MPDDLPPFPIDPDLDPDDPAQPARGRPAHPRGRRPTPPDVIGAIAAGGVLGATARYAVAQALPTPTDGLPWATFWTNIGGSFLLGLVLVLLIERPRARLLRPFLTTGVLGSFTTMSALQVEAVLLIDHDRAARAAIYLLSSIATGLLVAVAGMQAGRWLVATRPRSSQ